MLHVLYNLADIVMHLDPLWHSPNLSILSYRYMFRLRNNHVRYMLDVGNQLQQQQKQIKVYYLITANT